MVALPIIRASNALLKTTLAPGLVAVFVGGTSGIGLTTLLAFAKRTAALKPRVYIIGRNADAAKKVIAECEGLNGPGGEFIFLKGDMSLMSVVDEVCGEIERREGKGGSGRGVNLLFITAGVANIDRALSPEGLFKFTALLFYSRMRFISNLLPLFQLDPPTTSPLKSLRRILITSGGTHEGVIYPEDFQALHVSLLSLRGHLASISTLGLESRALQAPSVSFITDFPGTVDTPFSIHIKGFTGIAVRALVQVSKWMGTCVPVEECGERHLWLLTSARFPAREKYKAGVMDGVDDGEGKVAMGVNGLVGGGVYSTGPDCETAGEKVIKVLKGYRDEGMVKRLEEHVQGEFKRIKEMGSS